MTNYQIFDTMFKASIIREVINVSDSSVEKWSSLEEMADHLGVSKDTIYKWISKKQMPAHKIGRLWKFKISEVDQWVRNCSILK